MTGIFAGGLIIIIVLISAGHFVISRIKPSLSQTRIFVGIYLLLLIFAVAAFYCLDKTGSALVLENRGTGENEFQRFLETGRVEYLKGLRKLGRWSFTYRGQDLVLRSADKEHFWTTVVVERKEAGDETIEVICYTTGLQLPETDNPPLVKLKDGQLLLTNPPPVEINFYVAGYDFTMTQFTAQIDANNVSHELAQSILGNQIVLVRLPGHLQLIVDETVSVVEQK